MAIDPAPPTESNPGAPTFSGPTREFRAGIAFGIAGTFSLLALALGGASPSSGLAVQGVVAWVGPVLVAIVELGTAYGLALRARWAAAVAGPALAIIVIGGAISFVLALGANTLQLPIVPALAIWALLAPPSMPSARIGVASGVVLAAALVGAFWALPAAVLVAPGGLLVVDETALAPSLEVICDGEPGKQPTMVHVRYSWHWLRTEPWVAGQDVVRVDVYHLSPNGADYAIGDTDPIPAGISQADVAIAPPISFTFDVDLAATGFAPETVGFTVVGPNQPAVGSGTVNVRARYRHGARDSSAAGFEQVWRVDTNALCAW